MLDQIIHKKKLIGVAYFCALVSLNLFSQHNSEGVVLLKGRNITLSEAINITLRNNPLAKNAELKLQIATIQKGSIIDFGSTEISYHYGQINSALLDKNLDIHQSFGSPLAHIQKNKIVKQQVKLSEEEQQMAIRTLVMQVKTSWFQWLYTLQNFLLAEQESFLCVENLKVAQQRNEFTDSVSLEQISLETKFAEVQNNQYQAAENFKLATNDLKALLFINDNIFPADTTMEMYAIDVQTAGAGKFSPTNYLNYYKEAVKLRGTEVSYEKAKLFPEIAVGYFNQEIYHNKGFQGVSLNISVPLWYLPQKSRIKELKIQSAIANNELEYQNFTLQQRIENLRIKLDQLFVQLSFYRENALKQVDMLEESTKQRYSNQTMSYMDFMQNLSSIYSIRRNYYEKLLLYNITAVELEFYIK